jgi:hypothetical protein
VLVVSRRRLPGAGGYVYFVSSAFKSDLVKIGRTAGAIGDRLRSLQNSAPVALHVEAAIPAVNQTDLWTAEGLLHHYFKDERQHGEWFTRTERLDKAIDIVRGTWGKVELGLPAGERWLRDELDRRDNACEHWHELAGRWLERYGELFDEAERRAFREKLAKGGFGWDDLPVALPKIGLLDLTAEKFVLSLPEALAWWMTAAADEESA